MRCGACGTEIPRDLVGTFPCPSCGVQLLRTHAGAPASVGVVQPRRSQWLGWVVLPGVCIAMFFATSVAAFAWERERSELGFTLLLLLPLCFGALYGYVSRGFVRIAAGVAGVVVLLFVFAYFARLTGLA